MTQPGPDATVRDLVHRGTVTVTPAATLRDAAVVMERARGAFGLDGGNGVGSHGNNP